FMNYAHSYRLPNLDEFFSSPYYFFGTYYPSAMQPNLTPQQGNQYQLGIKDQSVKGLHLGFTVTEAQYKNEIFFDPQTGENSNYNGRTRHYSEEVDVSVDVLNKKVQPFANITFQQARYVKGEFSAHQITQVPDHLANAGVIFNPWHALSTSFTTHFVGKQFLTDDEANTHPKLKRYDTVDWSIKYNFKNMELWFAVNNIFNTYYYNYGIAGYSTNAYYPAPGRNFAAGFKFKF
ncbi:MAG: TonB-dependent receptor, partial [Candidatus Omnitrophica bacterium]|nr:TonB-dependent receptor [Candidatus Omnitrophota bacterium]